MRRLDELDERFVSERARNDERYVRRADFDNRLVTLEERIDRMPLEIVRQVSATLQAMVKDAMTSAIHEERIAENDRFREQFALMLEDHRTIEQKKREELAAQEREERRKQLEKIKAMVLYVLPFLTILNYVLQWAGVI